jgi:translocation and assembly module TamB
MPARHLFRPLLIAALIAAIALGAAALSWLSSPRALDWVAGQAVLRNQQQLQLEGLDGSLLGELRIARLRYDGATFFVEGEDLRLRWRPLQLLAGRLSLEELAAGALRYRSHDPTPPAMPDSLELPLTVIIERLDIGRLQFGTAPEIRGLLLRYRGDAREHRIGLQQTLIAGCALAGEISLAALRPYAAGGQWRARCGERAASVEARVSLGGHLESLEARLEGRGRGASANGSATLAPFAALPLQALQLEAEGVNLRAWRGDLPSSALKLALRAATRNEQLAGELSLANGRPGPWNGGGLPLEHMTAQWSLQAQGIGLDNIDIHVPGGGRIGGSASWRHNRGSADLRLRAIASASLDSRLHPLRIDGRARLEGDAGSQQASVALSAAGAALDARFAHDRGRLRIEQAELRLHQGRARLAGVIALSGRRDFSLSGELQRFDPSQLAALPAASLNGRYDAEGRLAGPWQARIRLDLAGSRLRGLPLDASADFSSSARQWFDGRARAAIGRNRLDIQGRYGSPGDQLSATLDAADLRALDPGWNGRLRGEGRMIGRNDGAQIDVRLDAAELALGPLRLAELRASGMLAPGAGGNLQLQADARKAQLAGRRIDSFGLRVSGSRMRHVIEAQGRGPGIEISLRAGGGLDADKVWRGTLEQLEAGPPWSLRLTAPAALSVGRDLIAVEQFRAALLGGTLGPLRLRRSAAGIDSEGSFTGIDPAPLLPGDGAVESAALRLGGQWAFSAGDRLNGRAAIRRESGDLRMRSGFGGGAPLAFALRAARLDINAGDGRVETGLEIDSATMGNATLRGRGLVVQRDGRWLMPGDSAIAATAALDLKSLAWLRAVVPALDRVDGTLSAQLRAEGSAAAPRWSGTVSGDRLLLRALGPGLDLREGRLRAILEGTQLRLAEFEIRAGQGRITAGGSAELGGGLRRLELQARAERAQILNAPQWSATLDGSGRLGLRERRLAIDGRFVLEEGRYDLGSRLRPTLGDDVVVRSPQTPAAAPARALPLQLDLGLDLNNRLALRGNGLDALLGGAIRVTSAGSGLTATGSVRAVRGSYRVFGQTLEIERGTVSFNGPLTNPGLDLRATRKFATAEVGVEVGGSLLRPALKLVSNPEMSDSDRLAWLALGRDPQGSDRAQLAVLQAAALSLAGGSGKPLTGRIAEGVGLDEIGFAGGGEGALGVVALGKRLTDRLSVRLEQTLGGTAGSLLRMDYYLSERWRLRGTAGAENAGDILFTWRFD